MRPFSKERARAYSNLLPTFIRENIEKEECEWKDQVFNGLKQAIRDDNYDEIEFWLTNLDSYQCYDAFSLSNDEIVELVKILFNFCAESEHWKLVANACKIFMDIFRPRHVNLDLVLPWKPLYEILRKLVFSKPRIGVRKPPPTLFQHLIPFIRGCNYMFEEGATEEMLALWKPMLDPHHHSFVMAHCLFSLFLPVHTGKHNLWFDDFMSIWPMYKSLHWDYQWIFLFARLSMYDYDDIDWSKHLPFLFQSVSAYIGIPHTLLDIPMPPVNDYPVDVYRVFFIECTSLTLLFPYYAYLFVNLLSNRKAKESVRWHIERMMYLMQPFCSPASQSDDNMSTNAAVVFISALINGYLKRIKTERKYGRHKLPVLTQEDHDWFVGVVAPLVLMERFNDSPGINNIKDLCQLSPEVLVPLFLETVKKSCEFERLENAGLKTLSSILPLIVTDPFYSPMVHDFLVKYAEDVNFMIVNRSLRIFSLFTTYARCAPIDESLHDSILVIMRKCIQFAEHSSFNDFNRASISMRTMIGAIVRRSSIELITDMLNLVEESIDKLSLKAIRVLIESFHKYAFDRFRDRVIHAKTSKDFAILLGLFRKVYFFIVPNLSAIEESLENGMVSEDTEISGISLIALKSCLLRLLSTLPDVVEKSGFVKLQDVEVKWHTPSQEEINAADELCEKFLNLASKFIDDTDLRKQILAVKIVTSVMKGTSGAITNAMFDVIPPTSRTVQPPLLRFSAPQLKRHWQFCYDFLSKLFSMDTPEKLLNLALKEVSLLCMPKDRIGVLHNLYVSEYHFAKALTMTYLSGNQVTHELATILAMQLYSYRHSIVQIQFTKQMSGVVDLVLSCCAHHSSKIRNRVSFFVQEVSAAFPSMFGPFFTGIISEIEERVDDRIALAGLTSVLCSCCQLSFTEYNFEIIGKAALCVCRTLPSDIPEDAAKALRQFIIVTLEFIDPCDIRFATEKFAEVRRNIAVTAVARASQYAGDCEVERYAISLVVAVAQGRPNLVLKDIYEFLINQLESDDVSVSDNVSQVLPSLLELLIPRVPKKRRVHVDKVTAENYDDVQFVDHRVSGSSTTEPYFMTVEEGMNPEEQSKFFPDGEERAAIYAMLYQKFMETNEYIEKLCETLVSQQVQNEETYCKSRVQFWASLIRVLGVDFSIKLLECIERLTDRNAFVAHHVIAGEIFSSVLFAIKGWKYSTISKLFPTIFPFLRRIVYDDDFEFQSVWFVSVACGLSDRDPRRFFWLFDHLLSCLNDTPSQIRDIKMASLVINVTLEFGWRMPEVISTVVAKGIIPWFKSSLQSYEQVRDCTIRAVSALFSCCFNVQTREVPDYIHDLFDNVLTKSGDQFLVSWLLSQFTMLAMSSFGVNRLAIDKIHEWIDMCLGKNEEDEKRARLCLVHLVRSNWLWSCSDLPLTIENAQKIVHRILKQLNPVNRVWQTETVMLLLIECFVRSNFFFFTDDDFCEIINDIVMPALKNTNYDIQDSAAELLAFLLKCSVQVRKMIPELVTTFKEMIFSSKDDTIGLKWSGVKGLSAIIHSTVLFDTVPDYVYDSFCALSEAQEMYSTLEPTISMTFSDFWSIHEENLMPDVAEALTPFRDQVRPSYFC